MASKPVLSSETFSEDLSLTNTNVLPFILDVRSYISLMRNVHEVTYFQWEAQLSIFIF